MAAIGAFRVDLNSFGDNLEEYLDKLNQLKGLSNNQIYSTENAWIIREIRLLKEKFDGSF